MARDVTWALALNATQARIVRGVHRDGGTDAPELLLEAEHPHLSDLMSDKPGRSYASVGSSRSAMEYKSDPVRDVERAFVDEVVEVLEKHRASGDFNRLAVFAAPEMLGILRPRLTDGLKAEIVAEEALNLLHLSSHDLGERLAERIFGR